MGKSTNYNEDLGMEIVAIEESTLGVLGVGFTDGGLTAARHTHDQHDHPYSLLLF